MVLSVKNTKGIINLSISECATTLPLNITKADGLFFQYASFTAANSIKVMHSVRLLK